MSTPQRPILTACFLAGVTLILYNVRLDTPLNAREMVFVEQARSVGGGTPLFFHVANEQWLQPLAVYATAAVHALGGGDRSGRIAATAVGALDIGLVFIAARMIFDRQWIAFASALLLFATPAHWWFARLGTDAIYPVPFVLGWLIAMLRFWRWDSPWSLVAAGLSLGLGMYSHPVAPLMMAWLWAISMVLLVGLRRAPIRNIAAIGGAFAALLLPLALVFLRTPSMYLDTFGRWGVLAAHLRFPLDGLRAQINWNTLSNRTSLMWGLLDPSFLFFTAKDHLSAPFLAVSAILVPLGLVRLAEWQPAHRALLLSAAVVPVLIAATFGESQELAYVVVMPAIAALLAGAGLESLSTRASAWKWLAAIALLASIYQLAA